MLCWSTVSFLCLPIMGQLRSLSTKAPPPVKPCSILFCGCGSWNCIINSSYMSFTLLGPECSPKALMAYLEEESMLVLCKAPPCLVISLCISQPLRENLAWWHGYNFGLVVNLTCSCNPLIGSIPVIITGGPCGLHHLLPLESLLNNWQRPSINAPIHSM